MEIQVIDISNVRGDLPADLTESYLIKFKTGDSISTLTPVHLYIAIDVSGSMMHENRLNNIKDTLKALLTYMKETDIITLYTFNNNVINYGDFVLNDTGKSQFINIINRLYPNNDTNIEKIFESLCLCKPKEHYKSAIIFMTDGEPTTGNLDRDYLISKVAGITNIEFVSIGYGVGHDAGLLEKIALSTKGSYYSIYNRAAVAETVGIVVGGVMSIIASNIKVYNDGTLITTPPNMIAESEYMVLSHMKPTHIVWNDSDNNEQQAVCAYIPCSDEDKKYVIQEYIRAIIVSGNLTSEKAINLVPMLDKLPDTPFAVLLKEEVRAMNRGSTEHAEQHRAFFRQQHGILTPRHDDFGSMRSISNHVQRHLSQGIYDTMTQQVPLQRQTNDPMYYTVNQEVLLYSNDPLNIDSNTV
jgi:uncharacterized protein YegL